MKAKYSMINQMKHIIQKLILIRIKFNNDTFMKDAENYIAKWRYTNRFKSILHEQLIIDTLSNAFKLHKKLKMTFLAAF